MKNDLNLDKFDTLVRSLRTCANPRDCEDCPYWARFGAQGCDRLEADAADAIQNLLEIIYTGKTLLPSTETIPAVDAVEVRHGWWEGNYPQAMFRLKRCSVCETLAPEGWYCFFCGAHMDGEEEHV